jgi:hypothetical protein
MNVLCPLDDECLPLEAANLKTRQVRWMHIMDRYDAVLLLWRQATVAVQLGGKPQLQSQVKWVEAVSCMAGVLMQSLLVHAACGCLLHAYRTCRWRWRSVG